VFPDYSYLTRSLNKKPTRIAAAMKILIQNAHMNVELNNISIIPSLNKNQVIVKLSKGALMPILIVRKKKELINTQI
jgi:hypothetical protein|tara:strand:+ start:391 stop:621 length:231 start_codon:yes stop_codon:yes gene_type:complete